MKQVRGNISNVAESNSSSIEKMLGILKILKSLGLKISDKWLTDLEIHYPLVWDELSETRKRSIEQFFGKIFQIHIYLISSLI